MAWMEWVVVGALAAVSAAYSVWRLLPKRKGQGDGCKGCSSHTPPPVMK
jgi:hypothetical protein